MTPTGEPQQGMIVRLVPDRGFGFIGAAGQEYFFHSSACPPHSFGELVEGQLVTFIPCSSDRGPRATSITLV